jgi:hypothetical protein
MVLPVEEVDFLKKGFNGFSVDDFFFLNKVLLVLFFLHVVCCVPHYFLKYIL